MSSPSNNQKSNDDKNPFVRQVAGQTKPLNIHQRILQVYKEVQTVDKNGKINLPGEGSYKAVNHDDVAALLHMPLANFGILPIPTQSTSKITQWESEKFYNGKPSGKKMNFMFETTVSVKFVNADDPSDFIESSATAYAIDSSDKAPGKAYSYAVKTIMLKVFMLESRDNEESRDFENENYGGQYSSNKNNQKKPPQEKKDEKKSILSEAQIKRLFTIAHKANWTNEDVKKCLIEGLGIDSTSKLSKKDYDFVIKSIEDGFDVYTTIDSCKS